MLLARASFDRSNWHKIPGGGALALRGSGPLPLPAIHHAPARLCPDAPTPSRLPTFATTKENLHVQVYEDVIIIGFGPARLVIPPIRCARTGP